MSAAYESTYGPNGPSRMRCNVSGSLKIRCIGVLLTEESVRRTLSELCRVNLRRHMHGRPEYRSTRHGQEVGVVHYSGPGIVGTPRRPCWMQRELLWELSSLFLVTQRRNSLEKCTCTLYRRISAGR